MTDGFSATLRRVAATPAGHVMAAALAIGLALAALQHLTEDLLTAEWPSEEALADLMVRSSPHVREKDAPEVLPVYFDEQSFQSLETTWQDFGPKLMELVQILRSGGPRVIGVDVGFAFFQKGEREREFLESCEKNDDVVFASIVEQGPAVAPISTKVEKMVRAANPPLGFANLELGADAAVRRENRGGIVRLASLEAALAGGGTRRSFALEVARRALGVKAADVKVGERELTLGDRKVRLEGGRVRVDYPGINFFHPLRAEHFLTRKLPAGMLKNRVVMVGSKAASLHDVHRTPLGTIDGLDVQASLVYTLLAGRPPVRVRGPFGGTLVVAIALAVGGLYLRLRRAAAFAASLVLVPAIYAGALFAFQHGIWLPTAFALLAVPVTGTALWGLDLTRAGREPAFGGVVRGTSGRSPEVTVAAGSTPDAGDLVLRVAREVVAARYDDAELLGRGGMGVVLRATDKKRGVKVAVKILSPLISDRPQLVARFLREIKALQQLEHPGVVQIFDVGDEGATPYYSMELIEGADLKSAMREGPFPLDRARHVFGQLLDVLGHIHAHGVIHRDIKPENILLTAGDKVKLLDFGLAHVPEATTLTQAGEIMGTLRYMSPEQMEGVELSPASDVFSVGLVIFEALTARMPFPEIGRVLHHSGTITTLEVLRGDIPHEVSQLLMDCVSPSSARRPADCGEMLVRWQKAWN